MVPYSSRWLPKPWWGHNMYLLSSLITWIALKESLKKGIQEKNFVSAPYIDCSFSTVFLVFLQNKQGLWGNYIFCYFSRIAALKMKTSKWVSKMPSVIRRKMSYIWQQRTNKVNSTYTSRYSYLGLSSSDSDEELSSPSYASFLHGDRKPVYSDVVWKQMVCEKWYN